MRAMRSHADAVRSYVRDLIPRQRRMTTLRHSDGLTYQEIGRVLDMDPDTVEAELEIIELALRRQT